jgi:hypothetical protein
MKKTFIFLLCIFSILLGSAQKVQIVPQLGFQYYGFSYISKTDPHPEDFEKSIPEFELAIGAAIKYKTYKCIHVLSIQNPILGLSFAYKNIFADVGINPTSLRTAYSGGPNLIFVSYSLQDESRRVFHFIGSTDFKLFFEGGIGAGVNKTRAYYREVLFPKTTEWISDSDYTRHTVQFNHTGSVGVFLPLKLGINFYNNRKKNFLTLQAFWNQGLTKMAEYTIDYEYGYFSYPQYQRSVKNVRIKSRGTVFGCTLGVPIRLIK